MPTWRNGPSAKLPLTFRRVREEDQPDWLKDCVHDQSPKTESVTKRHTPIEQHMTNRYDDMNTYASTYSLRSAIACRIKSRLS